METEETAFLPKSERSVSAGHRRFLLPEKADSTVHLAAESSLSIPLRQIVGIAAQALKGIDSTGALGDS